MAAQGAAQGVCLELSNDATADRLAGDREGLRGALVNVVRNAIEAQPDGGSIRVHARDASLAGQPAVEVEVCDDGPGLAPDVTERALQPFFTTKHEGTGLGLSLAARAIQAQGGALRLANRAGGGASVTMVIPLEPPSTA
jgi:signal transduction histidine kinase